MLRVMTNGVDHVARGVGDEIRVERLRQQIAQRAERQKKFGVRFVCHVAHIVCVSICDHRTLHKICNMR